jgi:UDP-N-acetylglucosamine--N-acetylmuramyl-(pentapeptide) pyrophosphoryl-undecaprenol N-acetylglucosamine transferase
MTPSPPTAVMPPSPPTAAMTPSPLHILIVGGGTGGHLFPGIATAQAFLAANPANRVLFASTGNAFERRTLAAGGFRLATVPSEGLKGRGLVGQLRALLKLPPGLMRSLDIIGRFRPDLVLGLGSYASAPLIAAAWLRRKPIVLCEQNIIPGITNRMLAPLARRIHISFEDTAAWFPARKTMLTGNPVRPDIRALEDAPAVTSKNNPKNDPHTFTVLVTGGSQGAHAVNLAVTAALPYLQGLDGLRCIHQTGREDAVRVQKAYQDNGIAAEVGAFFTDMASRYHQADLVVCRAGATTVAELTAMGKAALFIPFPFAADDHQTLNARTLQRQAAADLIPQSRLSGEALAQRLLYYYRHRDALAAMAARAKALGRPNAAAAIVADGYRLLQRRSHVSA